VLVTVVLGHAAMDSSNIKSVNHSNTLKYLSELDLGYLKKYMSSEQYTLPRWQDSDADTAILLYKRYLALLVKHGLECELVPTKEIDEVWHNHILHTKQYHQDCNALFGRYLHHIPSDLNETDQERLSALFQKTCEYYESEFNESLPFYQQNAG